MTMKKLSFLLSTVLILTCHQPLVVYGNINRNNPSTVVSTNEVTSINNQNMQGQGYANAQGGDSSSYAVSGDASSGSIANISTNSTSNYESRTSPVSMFPPYLPSWPHGGWGPVKAYFQNGPNGDDRVYERTFNPGNPAEMKELRGVLESLPHDGPLSFLGGILNGVFAVFGGPDNFHHGRGFEIASSVIRTRRPRGKPLLVFIDSNINKDFLRQSGIAYVGKISLEGTIDRNWDHVYEAAIAEALPWNVDIMFISGGMKGVTVGSNFTFPTAGGAYSQTNYSISLLGGTSRGITEGKGEAMVSAECYRYDPRTIRRRTIPQSFYEKIHSKVILPQNITNTAQAVPAPAKTKKQQQPGMEISQELYDMAGFRTQQQVNNMAIR